MTTNPKDFVITESAAVAGCVTYWRAGKPINIEALRDAWKAAGLDMALFRKEPEPVTAFRRAVLDQADRRTIDKTSEVRTLVRPQAEPHAWAVVEEFVKEGQPPVYETLLIASFSSQTGVPNRPTYDHVSGYSNKTEALVERIEGAFQIQSGTFAPEDITTWLVKLAEKKNAVTLRDTGGVYFIPRDAMDFWNKAAEAIETASDKTHRVFRIPAVRNSEAAEAIIDAVTAEAEAMARKIDEEVSSGLGDRALETRKGYIATMLAKVTSYEALVGQQLKIRERLETLQSSVAMANLVSSATPEEKAAVAEQLASEPEGQTA